MTTHDLTTARGVLMALADGHRFRSETGLSRLFVRDGHLVMEQDATDRMQDIVIRTEIRLTCSDAAWWQAEPKEVDAMDAAELARELYGDGAYESSGVGFARAASTTDAASVRAPTRDALLKQLRALVKAKRAGEL